MRKRALTVQSLGVGVLAIGLAIGCGGESEKGDAKAVKTTGPDATAPAPAKAEAPGAPANPMAEAEAAMDQMAVIVKKPITTADIDKVLKALPDLRKAGDMFSPKAAKDVKSFDDAIRQAEANAPAKAALAKHGLTARSCMETMAIMGFASSILKQGGPDAMAKKMAETKKQMKAMQAKKPAEGPQAEMAAAMQKQMMGPMMAIMEKMAAMAKTVPQSTYDAVKARSAQIDKAMEDQQP